MESRRYCLEKFVTWILNHDRLMLCEEFQFFIEKDNEDTYAHQASNGSNRGWMTSIRQVGFNLK
jgi:hypothetical protein